MLYQVAAKCVDLTNSVHPFLWTLHVRITCSTSQSCIAACTCLRHIHLSFSEHVSCVTDLLELHDDVCIGLAEGI